MINMSYAMSNILSNFLLHVLNGEDINEKIGLFTLTDKLIEDKKMFLYVLKNLDSLEITMEDDKFRFKAKTTEKDRTNDKNQNHISLFNELKKKGFFDISQDAENADMANAIKCILNGEDEEDTPLPKKDVDYNTLIDLGGTLSQANDKWDMNVDDNSGITVFAREDSEKISMDKNEIQALIKLIENCSSYCICHMINDDTDKFEGIRMSALV